MHSMPTLQSLKNLLHETLQMCEMRRKPYDNRMPKTEKKHLLNLPYARVNILLTTRTVQSTRTYKTQEVNRQSETSNLQVDEQPLHIPKIHQFCSKRCAIVLRIRRYYKVTTWPINRATSNTNWTHSSTSSERCLPSSSIRIAWY